MLQLLDSNGQRINYIITVLSNNNDWHYSKDLADDLGVSLRTISNDI